MLLSHLQCRCSVIVSMSQDLAQVECNLGARACRRLLGEGVGKGAHVYCAGAFFESRDKTLHARARKPEGHDISAVVRGMTGPGSAT